MTGSKDRHENRLCFSTAHRSIAEVIFPHNHCKTDLSFRMVVISRHIGMKKKRKEFIAVLGKTFRQSFGICIPIAVPENVRQANMQIGDAAIIGNPTNAFAINHKIQRLVDQPLEPSCKALPFGGTIAQRYLLDFSQQVYDTLLLGKRLDSIIGGEKVGDQNSLESVSYTHLTLPTILLV